MKGDGSHYQTRDHAGRLRWVAAVYVPGRTSPVRRWLPPGATEQQAKRTLRELRNARARGELDPKPEPEKPPEPLPTMAEMADTWIAAGYPGGRKKAGGPNPKTRRMYDDLVRLHLARSALGRMRLDAVRRRDVASFLADEAAAGASRSAVQKLKGIVARTYRHGQLLHEDELGDRVNPADIELPKTKEPNKRRALVVPEIVVLLDQVRGDRLFAAWLRLAMDIMDELLAPGIAARALGHVVDHGSATTAGYIHRRIVTVRSAVLDLALRTADEQAAGE